MQAKKPAKPYAPKKSDGSSYAQLHGGMWHGLWIRIFPSPRWHKDEAPGTHHEFDKTVDLAGYHYELCANSEQDPAYADWRQVHYECTNQEED